MQAGIIPEFAAIANTLNTILEKLNIGIVQNEIALKRSKSALNSTDIPELFRIEDQRVYIAGQIAGNINHNFYFQDFRLANRQIIEATDDLICQLRIKE